MKNSIKNYTMLRGKSSERPMVSSFPVGSVKGKFSYSISVEKLKRYYTHCSFSYELKGFYW